MPLTFECPYCASCESKLISNFYSAVLDAKTAVYQCQSCLDLFDVPRQVKEQEFQKSLSNLQQNAEERMAIARAANVIRVIDNQELATTIAQIQQESLTTQLDLICQKITAVNPTNKELLQSLEKKKVDTQIKLIEVRKQELQMRLSDLQAEAEEWILGSATSDIVIDPAEGESQMVVVIYYDGLINRVPIDSFWTTPSNIISSNPEPTTLINVTDINPLVSSPVPHLLKLLFGLLQVFFGIWLLCLAFGF